MSYKAALNFSDGVTKFVDVNAGEVVLDAALRQGIKLPMDCREGVCSTCKGICISGEYEQDYVDEDALTESDLAGGAVLTCQMKLSSHSAIDFDCSSEVCNFSGPETINAIVDSVVLISDTTAMLKLDASDENKMIDFLPGQYANLRIPGTDQWRSYSFAHNPNEKNKLQFLIRRLPSGVMSDYLGQRAAPGDNIELKAPMGSFYLRQTKRPLLFVAGGTGLSAFLGILDDMMLAPEAFPKATLIYGVTHENDLCEIECLFHLQNEIEGFSFKTVVLKPTARWIGNKGLVTDIIDEKDVNDGDVDVYLCGPPAMVDAVDEWFQGRGLEGYTLRYEKFSAS